MIASLMMYARPELAAAHARFWSLIRDSLRDRGIPAPQSLSQTDPEFDVWLNPELALSQTCGMPYRLWLHREVSLVGTPDYGLDDCPPGDYRSAVIIRHDDPRTSLADFDGARFAFNVPYSQSGFAAPFAHVTPIGFWFQDLVQTGAHGQSAKAVAEGRADIAALDAVTWRLLQRFDPVAQGLRVLDWTSPTPGLPLITSKRNDAGLVLAGVRDALTALDGQGRSDLGLRTIVDIPKERYLQVPNPAGIDYSQRP